jgi:hypothetical protein
MCKQMCTDFADDERDERETGAGYQTGYVNTFVRVAVSVRDAR